MSLSPHPSRITRFGLFLFAFGLPFSHVPAQFGIGVALLGWLLEGAINKNWQLRWHVFFVPLAFYLSWNVLAAALSTRPPHSLGAVVDNEWPLLIMLMLFWTVRDVETLMKLVSVFLGASSVAMVYAIWQTFGGIELYRKMLLDPIGFGYYRAVGFYGFYLTFAALAMSVFFLSASLFVEVKNSLRWRYAVYSVLGFLAVVGTFARSMWLSFGAALPLLAFLRSRRTGIVVTGTLSLLVAVGIWTVPALRYRAESIIDVSQNQTRLNLWKTAVRISSDYPVLGVGEDNWDHVFERYRVEGYYDTTVHPHNDYLNILVASGYPGLVAFVAMWGIAFIVGFTAARQAKDERLRGIALGSTFSLLGLLVGSLFQNYYGTFVNCLGWWYVVGLIFSAYSLMSARESNKDYC